MLVGAVAEHPRTFQYNYDLHILSGQRLGRKLIQWASSINSVTDDEWWDEEDAIAPEWVFHLDVKLADWNHLPFCRHGPANHLGGVAQDNQSAFKRQSNIATDHL